MPAASAHAPSAEEVPALEAPNKTFLFKAVCKALPSEPPQDKELEAVASTQAALADAPSVKEVAVRDVVPEAALTPWSPLRVGRQYNSDLTTSVCHRVRSWKQLLRRRRRWLTRRALRRWRSGKRRWRRR